jgi:Na+-transporting NADH:ubiquinone oxidoreductase subunit NqrB
MCGRSTLSDPWLISYAFTFCIWQQSLATENCLVSTCKLFAASSEPFQSANYRNSATSLIAKDKIIDYIMQKPVVHLVQFTALITKQLLTIVAYINTCLSINRGYEIFPEPRFCFIVFSSVKQKQRQWKYEITSHGHRITVKCTSKAKTQAVI